LPDIGLLYSVEFLNSRISYIALVFIFRSPVLAAPSAQPFIHRASFAARSASTMAQPSSRRTCSGDGGGVLSIWRCCIQLRTA
jgi:hypothetical protein